MKSSDILFTILNYKEKENSEKLYKLISPYFLCRILDAESGERPSSFDGDTIYLPNIFFGGLLNKAIELAQRSQVSFLFFICSDVCIGEENFMRLKDILLREDFSDVAIYAPSHQMESYTFVQWAYHQSSDKKRRVPCVEAMVSMLHCDIFNKLYPCAENKFGWGIDICAAYYAKSLHKEILVDDRVQLYHPCGGTSKNDAASACAFSYISHHNKANDINDLWHWIYIYRLNKSANILLLKHYKFWCSFFYKLRKVFPNCGYKF